MTDFYVLLVLSQSDLHAYAIKGAAMNSSLGSLRLTDGNLSKVLRRMHDEGLIDVIGMAAAGKSGTPRRHYTISEYGKVRLQEELERFGHAMKIAESAGLLGQEKLSDLDRSLMESRITG